MPHRWGKRNKLILETEFDEEPILEPVRIEYEVTGPWLFIATGETHSDAGRNVGPAVPVAEQKPE